MVTNTNGIATTLIPSVLGIDGFVPALELSGLSTDTKPTGEKIPNGSSFLEMDTGTVYFWDKENSQWRVV